MNLTLFVAEKCPACERALSSLQILLKNNSEIKLRVEDITKCNSEDVAIVPALFIESSLFSYGEVDLSKLSRKLSIITEL